MFFRDWKLRICCNINDYDGGHYNKLSTGMATSHPLYFLKKKSPESHTRFCQNWWRRLLNISTSLTRFVPRIQQVLLNESFMRYSPCFGDGWGDFGGSLSTNRLQGSGVPLRIDSVAYPQRNTSTFNAVNFIKADSWSDIWKLNKWGVLSMN